MRLKIFFIAVLGICLCSSFTIDQKEYKLITSIPFNHARLTTDRLGNAYIIVENQLLLFDTAGKPKGNYSNLNSGNLVSVDASNPLKLLLFYPDFARLELLNNKLSLESTIELRALGIIQP